MCPDRGLVVNIHIALLARIIACVALCTCGACTSAERRTVSAPVSSVATRSASGTASFETRAPGQVTHVAAHRHAMFEDVSPPALPDPLRVIGSEASRLGPERVPRPADFSDPLGVDGVLSLERLVEQVQARNPSVRAATEAWRAAAERYPQVVSLDDPMFGFMQGLDMGYMVEAAQKIPWPGKRQLRGEAADAEANAARYGIADTELRLSEAAGLAFCDYFQAARELEVSAETVELLAHFKDIAMAKYEANQATQQDVYQAELELALVSARMAELRRSAAVAAARINTLLHRPAHSPLPPPPAMLSMPTGLPPADTLHLLAVRQRPDLAAQRARVRAEDAGVELACKEYYPDLELVYQRDEFMVSPAMYNQIGLNINVPLYRVKRDAGVREAQARAERQRAEFRRLVDEAAFEVQAATERLEETVAILELYESRILPAAKANIESAQEYYIAGQLDFLRLIEAQRQLRDQQERFYRTMADLHRRTAELRRALGGSMPHDPLGS
jgi:outer membrane protein, heavy metal efflux system